jgi:hypothetical protein
VSAIVSNAPPPLLVKIPRSPVSSVPSKATVPVSSIVVTVIGRAANGPLVCATAAAPAKMPKAPAASDA